VWEYLVTILEDILSTTLSINSDGVNMGFANKTIHTCSKRGPWDSSCFGNAECATFDILNRYQKFINLLCTFILLCLCINSGLLYAYNNGAEGRTRYKLIYKVGRTSTFYFFTSLYACACVRVCVCACVRVHTY